MRITESNNEEDIFMKVAVRYYTKTGNTKRLAESIGNAVGVEALPISTPIMEPVDILFLGNSYYAFSIDPEVRDFVKGLDKCIWRRPTAGFAKQNGRGAERAATCLL